MSDDLLARSTRALREQTESRVDDEVATATLARVERSFRGSRLVSRSRARWIAWPIAASFFVLTAWASASGRLAQWVALAAHSEVEEPQPLVPAPTLSAAPAVPSPKPVILPAVPSSESESEPDPDPTPSIARRAPPKAIDVDALYRDAHEAHFVKRDPRAALAAWDRYLAAAGPNGNFVLEARYNRALSLIRLGRKSEAAVALRPFANGDYGGYRRDEATQLLTTLE